MTNLAPPAANAPALGSLGSLFAHLGIKDTATRNALESLLTSELERRGHHAQVVGIRYNVATLLADPHHAALLRYDLDAIRATVNATVASSGGSPLDDLVVTTRRRAGERAR